MDLVQNIKKKSAVIFAVTVCLLFLAATAGVSLAILMTNTEERANAFTFGNVTIDLLEPEWDGLDPEDKVVYPDKTVPKDPQVKNTGKNALYAYIEVKVPKREVRTVVTDGEHKDTVQDADMHELFSFEPSADWTLIRSASDDTYNVYLYAYTKEILLPGSTTSPLFGEVKYINMLEGEIGMNTVIEMPITAYAIQSEYLNESENDIAKKMRDAFDEYESALNG